MLQIIEPLDFIQAGVLQGDANIFRFGLIARASLITGMMCPVSIGVSPKYWVGLPDGPAVSSSLHMVLVELKSLAPIGTRQNASPIPPELNSWFIVVPYAVEL